MPPEIKFKDISVREREREQRRARELKLDCPEAGVPDLDSISEVFGFDPEDLRLFETHPAHFIRRIKVKGVSPRYDYPETDHVGGDGRHKEQGGDWDQ